MKKLTNSRWLGLWVITSGLLQVAPAWSAEEADLRFAAIGDYGTNDPKEAAVAQLVKNWKPEFIITLGDNNYSGGESTTIDQNVGKYYHEYILNYHGSYGAGSIGVQRFFPCFGNHDWDCSDCDALPKPY